MKLKGEHLQDYQLILIELSLSYNLQKCTLHVDF